MRAKTIRKPLFTAAAFDGNVTTGILVGAAAGALCDDVRLCR